MTALVATNLRKTYPAPRGRARRQSGDLSPLVALAGVSLAFEPGTWTAIMGANGSGKSTLLRALARSAPLDSGKIGGTLDTPHGRAVIFQSHALDELLTVRENLRLAASMHGLPREQADAEIDRFTQALGVGDRLRDRVGSLSGGLARRVDLARALVVRPKLLLLDEPSSGLDPESRSIMLDLLSTWQRDTAATIVASTHLDGEARRADRVVFMHRGQICGDDAPKFLLEQVGPFVAEVSAEVGADAEAAERALGATSAAIVRTPRAVIGVRVRDAGAALAACRSAGLACRVGPATLMDALTALSSESGLLR